MSGKPIAADCPVCRGVSRRRMGMWAIGGLCCALGVFARRAVVELGNSPEEETTIRVVPTRKTPLAIANTDDLSGVVSDDKVRGLLVRLVPCWHAFKLSYALHAFRLWGSAAEFPDDLFSMPYRSRVFSGGSLQSLFFDYEEFHRILPLELPLFTITPNGIAPRIDSRVHGSHAGGFAHADDFLCACSELGLDCDTPIRFMGGVSSLAALVQSSLLRFSLAQELEWSAEGLARYIAPINSWVNAAGESISFDAIALAMLGKPIGTGACCGTHIPYSLMSLLRIDAQCPILRRETSSAITEYFHALAHRLEQVQKVGGVWPFDWGEVTAEITERDRLASDLVATSHHLEWIAIAPSNLRPSSSSIAKAIVGVLGEVSGMTVFEISGSYPWLSHLARALCLMKREEPAEIVRL